MWQVKKRDNSLTDFKIDKIKNAIHKAFKASNKRVHGDVLDLIALRATSDFEDKIKDDVISVEDIQDSVEHVLSESGYSQVAKAYILYRREHQRLREMEAANHQFLTTIESYLVGTKENSIGGFVLNNSATLTELYWLEDIYDRSIREAVKHKTVEIEGLGMLAPYSRVWNLQTLLEKGILSVRGKVGTRPAKHFNTACSHITNFIEILQNEWVGCLSFSHVDTLLAPFVRKDKLSYSEVKQSIQTLIYGINMPSRWGNRCPYSHFSLDGTIPELWKEKPVRIAGVQQDYQYKDLEKEAKKIRLAFYEVLLEGDGAGKPFEYPELSVHQLEKELLPLLKKRQTVFLSQPSYSKEESMVYGKVKIEFHKKQWKDQLELAKNILVTQRKVLDGFMENGLYPYSLAYGPSQTGYSSVVWKLGNQELDGFLQEILEVSLPEGIRMEFEPSFEEDVMHGLATQEKIQHLDGVGKIQSIELIEEMSDEEVKHFIEQIQRCYSLQVLGFYLKETK